MRRVLGGISNIELPQKEKEKNLIRPNLQAYSRTIVGPLDRCIGPAVFPDAGQLSGGRTHCKSPSCIDSGPRARMYT